MVSVVAIALVALPLYWAYSTYTGLQRNIKLAKSSGLPYIVVPVWFYSAFWMSTASFWMSIVQKIFPERWYKSWYKFVKPDWNWIGLYEPLKELGADTFITVSPVRNILWVATAEAIHQITSRRDAFPKPIGNYKVLEVYGRNVVTTEGAEWRMHRKATSPGFNEKNNALVFKESISQAQGMIRNWIGVNETSSPTLRQIPTDTMRVTLHIISAMGFGVRLLWPSDKPSEDDKHSDLLYYGAEPSGGHTMSFQNALATLLDNIFVILLTPRLLLKFSPLKKGKQAWEAYVNWKQYMDELLEKKVAAELTGERSEGMDIMGSLVKNAAAERRANEKTSPGQVEPSRGSRGLTDEDIIGNSFVMLLAGHETTANTIHFALIELAMNPISQRHLQKEVLALFGDSDPETWDYDTNVNPLLGGMVGAVINEMLRLMPPVTVIPKTVRPDQDQAIVIKGQKYTLPRNMIISINVTGVQRNPKYWPSMGPSKVSGEMNDLNDFVPERWLRDDAGHNDLEESDHDDFGSFTGKTTSAQLFCPIRGSYLPFSDGPRSCLGRRLAQVELLAVLSVIFQKYSVELAVDEWATDEEVAKMSMQEKKEVYAKAAKKSREVIRTASSMITLKLHHGQTYIPVRVVKRGTERFF